MGTSASSKGPGGGVPMVPPWVPDPVPQNAPNDETPDSPENTQPPDGQGQPNPQPPPQPIPIAPRARFGGARRNFGDFVTTGDPREMRRGLRDYIRKGYGGHATAVRRFGGTAATAGALLGALSNVAAGQPAAPDSALAPNLLAGRSAREVMDAIVEAIRPTDGTQDAEASRAAINDALSELLTMFPAADLLSLTENQRILAVERYVAIDVYRRIALDIGKVIQDKAPTAAVALERLKEIKDYIKETIASRFKELRDAGKHLTTSTVNHVVQAALDETFQVFEAYVG